MVFRPVVVLAEAVGALWTLIGYKDSDACAAGEYSGLLVDAALVSTLFVLLHFPAVPVVADDRGGLLRQAPDSKTKLFSVSMALRVTRAFVFTSLP